MDEAQFFGDRDRNDRTADGIRLNALGLRRIAEAVFPCLQEASSGLGTPNYCS